ncbi:MAG: hypothetical protein R2860_10765 [Desulfobacterales bacterium]
MPPIIRLTNLGIRQVHPELVEARQSLRRNRMAGPGAGSVPWPRHTILAGLNPDH